MNLSKTLSVQQWIRLKEITAAYDVDPMLIAAIGRHETDWGRLGAGRDGWYLGYGYFPGSTVAEKYRGFDEQIRGACYQLKRDLKKPLTADSLMDFSVNSWKAGNPQQWAISVWSIYENLTDDLTAQVFTDTEPTAPTVLEPQTVNLATVGGMLKTIAANLVALGDILQKGGA